MTDKGTLILLLCMLAILFYLFLISCYKRVFIEKTFATLYVLVWSIVTILQINNSVFVTERYLIFSLFVAISIVCTFTVAHLLKKYLKTLFSSLIELSFDEKCTSQIVIFRDAIGTCLSIGYIIYVYDAEKLFTYQSIDDIILDRHRQIALRLNQINRKNMD